LVANSFREMGCGRVERFVDASAASARAFIQRVEEAAAEFLVLGEAGQEADVVAAGGSQLEEGDGNGCQDLPNVADVSVRLEGVEHLGSAPVENGYSLLEDGADQALFVAEVILDGGRVALTAGADDLSQGYAVDAPFGEEPLRVGEKVLPGLAARWRKLRRLAC
jgi:hypothetical protein